MEKSCPPNGGNLSFSMLNKKYDRLPSWFQARICVLGQAEQIGKHIILHTTLQSALFNYETLCNQHVQQACVSLCYEWKVYSV